MVKFQKKWLWIAAVVLVLLSVFRALSAQRHALPVATLPSITLAPVEIVGAAEDQGDVPLSLTEAYRDWSPENWHPPVF